MIVCSFCVFPERIKLVSQSITEYLKGLCPSSLVPSSCAAAPGIPGSPPRAAGRECSSTRPNWPLSFSAPTKQDGGGRGGEANVSVQACEASVVPNAPGCAMRNYKNDSPQVVRAPSGGTRKDLSLHLYLTSYSCSKMTDCFCGFTLASSEGSNWNHAKETTLPMCQVHFIVVLLQESDSQREVGRLATVKKWRTFLLTFWAS